ncbi:amidohydrolase family protein [Bradyrhizobium sp. UFLA05-153]
MTDEESCARVESIIEPELAMCDPHHHLWDFPQLSWPHSQGPTHYLLAELLADISSGHRVESTVYVEAGAFYRGHGPEPLRCVGETEFAGGMAAMAASGRYGPVLVCEGIVGRADLAAGASVADVLEAHIRAGNGRFKGIRFGGQFDPDPDIRRMHGWRPPAGLYSMPKFREGFVKLRELGLCFDALEYHTQIGEVTELADAFPDVRIVLGHAGMPLGIGSYAGKRDEVFAAWKSAIDDLAQRENVYVKLGGLGMVHGGFGFWCRDPKAGSRELAVAWRPYVETCIEAFGPCRSMFESNFPVDGATCDYKTLWNAFKLIAAGASGEEKAWLFKRSARRFYQLD